MPPTINLAPEPLVQFSDRLYFTTFPHPPPPANLLNSPKVQLHPKVRSRTRFHSGVVIPDEEAQYYWFTIDDDLPYMSFFEDWGPLNLGQVYKACILIHELLEDVEIKHTRLCLYSSNDPRRKANAALLMALFVQIVQRRQPWEAFHPIAEMEFMPFRDAGRGRSDFNLSIQDCLYGFWKATQFGLCDLNEFSLEDYEKYEKVENGDWNWITPHFIAFASPVDTVWMKNGGPSQQQSSGSRAGSTQPQSQGRAGSHPPALSSSSSLQKKLPTPFLNCLSYFAERSIKVIVRLNNPLYDKNTFLEKGFEHVELYFDDGTNPTDEIVRKFLDLSERTIDAGGVVAVHCKAGLGRTGTLIGAYLIYKYGFTANEAIAFMRIVRPGCVVGPQQQYMYTRQLEWAKWSAVDEYRRQQESEAVRGVSVSRMGAITPPSEDELALVVSSRPAAVADELPTTPKAGQKRLRKEQEHPVTPPPRERIAAAAAAAAAAQPEPSGPPPPLDVTQGPPPGQPRKTPRTQRVLAAMELDEADAENYAHINAPDLAAEDDEEEDDDDKMANAEEAKDTVGALGIVRAPLPPPPASPVKGAVTRGRAAQPKPVRQAPASERTTRTTRASTRTQTAATTTTTTGRAGAGASAGTAGHAAALRARGASAAAKAKAASGTGAGAATTSTTNTSYKIPRLAANTTTASASASRMRPPSALGTRRAVRPVSPSPGSPQPIPSSRLPVPTTLIPSKRGYGVAGPAGGAGGAGGIRATTPGLPNGGGPLHSYSDSSTATLQVPGGSSKPATRGAVAAAKKGRRGSAGSIGSVVSVSSPGGGGSIRGDVSTEQVDPDAWMSGEAAGAILNKSANGKEKGERPLLRSVRRRRSSFSNADVII